MDNTYLIRERALVMAQCDWHAGLISENQVLPKAREYEIFLLGPIRGPNNLSGGIIHSVP